ncbi:hypothetical protein BpHYR1_028069 [Brachionus plicatilis]|uniref:Uncharacterized protein n=1 Tax=Brachionus plicatilis TaxID=10195 RepID=A0A3M7R3A9_BRAPC|nr:hypothetical protein BpHYR1_028069 [Brachionus plicatilis]
MCSLLSPVYLIGFFNYFLRGIVWNLFLFKHHNKEIPLFRILLDFVTFEIRKNKFFPKQLLDMSCQVPFY